MSTLHPLSSSFSCTFSPPLVLLLLLPLSSSSFSFSPGRWRTMPVEKVRVWRRCRGGWLLCSATTQTDGAERSEVTENPWHHTHTHTGAWNPFSFFLIARLLMTVFPMNVLKVLLTDFDKKNIFYQSSSEICLFLTDAFGAWRAVQSVIKGCYQVLDYTGNPWKLPEM